MNAREKTTESGTVVSLNVVGDVHLYHPKAGPGNGATVGQIVPALELGGPVGKQVLGFKPSPTFPHAIGPAVMQVIAEFMEKESK